MRTVYLDNAAATPIDPLVMEEMKRTSNLYGNPSSFNDAGRITRTELDRSRLTIARFLGATKDEIVFTGSGSEANNLAILGAMAAHKDGGEVVSTPIEHPSVIECLDRISSEKGTVKYVKVDIKGMVDIDGIISKINKKTVLVSVMYANNEIGSIQPILKIGKAIKNYRDRLRSSLPLFHVDACQATEYLDMNVNRLGIDLLSFNGSKIYGPRGIGVLYVRNGVQISPIILGGSQEHGLRGGTENLPAIAGLAKAVQLIGSTRAQKVSELRDHLIEKIKKEFPDSKLNGSEGKDRLPNNINVSFSGLASEQILIELDKHGIYAGSGSACTARSVEPSHVLKAIGVDKRYLSGAVRFSLGRQNTMADVNHVVRMLVKVVKDLKKRYSLIID